MKLSKISIAYLLIACMLLTFMPVITSAAETTDNYISSDYISVSGLTNGQPLSNELNLSGLSNYDNIFEGYLMFDHQYTEDPSVTTALYHKQGDRPVFVGSCGDAWTEFVHDFRLKVTYNDQTKYIQINGIGTDAHCAWVRFGLDEACIKAGLGLADDAVVADVFTKENVTGFELVPVIENSTIKPLSFDVNVINKASGALRGKADFDIHCYNLGTTLLAETYPEYFYLGTKKTVETYATSGIIVRMADGSAKKLSEGAVTAQDLPLFRDLALSGTYTENGTAYTFDSVPFTQVRQNGVGNALFFKLDTDELLKQIQAKSTEITSVSSYGTKLSDYTLVPRKVNIGKFPEGTIFISPAELKHNATSGYAANIDGSGYQGFYRNNDIAGVVFTAPEAGQYVLYDAVKDQNGSRGSDVYVNDTKITTSNTGASGISGSTWAYYWKPTNGTTVTLNKGENVFTLPRQDNVGYNNAGTSYRVLGWAFVPADKAPTFTADEAQALTSILNPNGKFPVLSWLAEKTHGEAYYSYADVTGVTVNNGAAMTVVPGAAQARGQAPLRDAEGNFIEAPTVVDAIAAAGVDYSTVKAVKVNGKTVDPNLTYLSNGMAVTTYTTVDKTNFAPHQLTGPGSSAQQIFGFTDDTNGVGLQINAYKIAGDQRSPVYYLPFLTDFSVGTTRDTTASDGNLIGCKVNGYVTLNETGSNTLVGMNSTYVTNVGDKVYFLNDNIASWVAPSGNRIDVYTEGKTICSGNKGNSIIIADKMHRPFSLINTVTWYELDNLYLTNTTSTNDLVANKIKAGQYQLLTTGTVPCQIIISKNGVVQSITKEIITCVEPYNLKLNKGETALVWNDTPYNGDKTAAGIWNMKPLCDVLTY